MLFFPSPAKKAMKAIDNNDIAALGKVLDAHPELLDTKLSWGGYNGFLLNYAAAKDMPKVIEYLVQQKGADVDRNEGVGARWTPLHHAKKFDAHRAAARLLELGADPQVKNENYESTERFAKSIAVRNEMHPAFRKQLVEKEAADIARKARIAAKEQAARQKAEEEEAALAALTEAETVKRRVEGSWTLTGPAEVTYIHELPDGSQRLTDIFNFQTRIWRATVSDLNVKSTAQNIIFFDQLPDAGILQQAFDKLKALGGKADESTLPAGLAKKPLPTPKTP